MPFQRILVPVDMSEHSRKAFEVAAELAGATGGELYLLNAYGLPPSAYRYMAYTTAQMEVADLANRELLEWKERYAPANVKVHVQTSSKEPRSAIASVAAQIGADLIVIGTHGHTGVKHLLLGSVAESVVRGSGCPVLIVRAQED